MMSFIEMFGCMAALFVVVRMLMAAPDVYSFTNLFGHRH